MSITQIDATNTAIVDAKATNGSGSVEVSFFVLQLSDLNGSPAIPIEQQLGPEFEVKINFI